MKDAAILFEDEHLRIEWFGRSCETLVLCFTGIGHGMGGVDVQSLEFSGTGLSLGDPVFITDKARSWGNNFDFSTVTNIVDSVAGGSQRIALGNSMGAFLAIAASAYIKLDHVLAFAPQYSVSPEVVTREKRWIKYREKIKEFKIPSLRDHFSDDCQYHIFHGEIGEDYRHWTKFPSSTNIRNFIVRNSAHDVALDLKTSGRLSGLISDCLYNDTPVALLCNRYDLISHEEALAKWKQRRN